MTKRKLDLSKFGEAFEQKKRKREQKRKLLLIPLEDWLIEEMKEEPILWFWHMFLYGFRTEFEKFEERVGAE